MSGVRPPNQRPASSLIEYREVLEAGNELSRPLVIVGGQAVNFWAARYAGVEPRLDDFRPFTSKDLDVLTTRDQVHQLAAVMMAKGWRFVPPEQDAEAVLGNLRQGDLMVEFLAPGHRPAMPPSLLELPMDSTSLPVRVIHPLMLLEGKIDLALRIPQDGSLPGIEKRRDLEHIRMLGLLIPCYLRDLAAACTDDQDRARVLQAPIAVLASIRYYSGEKLDAAYPDACQWGEILPIELHTLPFDDPHRLAVRRLTGGA